MDKPEPRHLVLEVKREPEPEPDPGPDLPRLGRPPVGPRISTCVTVETLTQIERFAEEWRVSRAEAARILISAGIAALLRPPQEHDLVRSEIEAQAEARGLSPAALLGVGYGSVLARRGGGQ